MKELWDKMGKIEENKRIKKEALLSTAYDLFTTKGINSTAISDIVNKAGVAKGTFYLYFRDKYDIRNKLVVHKTSELFTRASLAMEAAGVQGLEEQMVFIINYIIDELVKDRPLLHFISKDLVMGALRSTLLTGEVSDTTTYDAFLHLVEDDSHQYNDIPVMLFTIVELAGSAGYNSIIYGEPLPIDEYKPFLNRAVRMIIRSHQAT